MGFSSQAGFCCARSCRGNAGRSTQASRRTAHLAITTARSPTLVLDNIDLYLTGFVGTPPRFAAERDERIERARLPRLLGEHHDRGRGLLRQTDELGDEGNGEPPALFQKAFR